MLLIWLFEFLEVFDLLRLLFLRFFENIELLFDFLYLCFLDFFGLGVEFFLFDLIGDFWIASLE